MKGSELARLRKELHMTQEDFAARLEVSRPHLANIESKDSIVPKSLLFKVNALFAKNETNGNKRLIKYYDISITSAPMEIFDENPSLPSINLDLPNRQ